MSMGISSISNNMSFDPTAMFKKLDANSDGGITKEEFLAGIKKQEGDSDEKLTKMFEETDTDGDGKISQAENETAMKKMAQGSQGAQKPKGPSPGGGAGKDSSSSSSSSSSTSTNYDVRDTNKDGTVSNKEKLAYILKQLQELENTDTSQNEYNQSGESTSSNSLISTTFSVSA
jgi:Ca2+-binding EF-hand superfamily protein